MPTNVTTATATAKVSIKCEQLRKQWFLCECSGSYIKSNKSFHIKSKKHQQYLKLQYPWASMLNLLQLVLTGLWCLTFRQRPSSVIW